MFETGFLHGLIWRIAIYCSKIPLVYEESIFYRLVRKTACGFLKVLRKPCPFMHALFKNSISDRLLETALHKFTAIICLFIFINSIVPYDRWHNQYGMALTAVIAFLYVLKAARDSRYGFDIERLDIAFILFAMSAALSVMTSIAPADSLRVFACNAAAFILVFILVNAVRSQHEIDLLVYTVIAGTTFISIYGLFQAINHVPVDYRWVDINMAPGMERIFSTMGNPNNFAEILILTIPFYWAVFLNVTNTRLRFFTFILMLPPLLCIWRTYSRSGWIGMTAALLAFILLKERKLAPFVLLLGLALLPFIPAQVVERMESIGKDTSSTYRFTIWKNSLKILGNNWLTGIGTGPESFFGLYRNYTNGGDLPVHSHMLFLQIWLEQGIVGITAFAWFIARMVKKGMSCIRRYESGQTYENGQKYENKRKHEDKRKYEDRHNLYENRHSLNVTAAIMASMAGISVMGLVEYVWYYPRVMVMFWIDAAILMCTLNLPGCGVQGGETASPAGQRHGNLPG